MQVIDHVDRFLGVCERVFHVLANACLAIMLTINILNVAKRAIFDVSIQWVFGWSVVLFVWMTFLGFFVVYRKNKDITVDFVIERLGEKAQFASRILVNVIVIGLMIIMLVHAPKIMAQQVGEIEMVGLERYTMSIPLFISCALILLNFVVDTVHAFRDNGAVQPKSVDGS
ncbi:MAG: TRAP transporter small permease [Rhodospirillales bacterium]|jgi:TRAP-type C4-dicarboxylate transport system permease small subunit|nr:TRAP transporter small permease [Rhodospirillales bacterium]